MVRWRSEANRSWEIDTRLSGFASAEQAAIAANGLGCNGFEKLVLQRGELFIITVKEVWLQVEEVAVWTMPAEPVDLPEDLQFERGDDSLGMLSVKGWDGVFEAKRFRVVDDRTGRDVAVRFATARSRIVVVVGGFRAERASDIEVPRA